MKSIVRFLSSLLCLSFACSLSVERAAAQVASKTTTTAKDEFAGTFALPQDSLKPWVYYYWISDNISREGITKDLEAMANAGIGQVLIGNIGLDEVPSGKVPFFSDEWWQLTEHAIREGKRVGVNVGLFNSPGWSQSGGPWVKPGEAMRYLVSSEITVTGGRTITEKIPAPRDTFQDVRLIAFPSPKDDLVGISQFHPTVSASPGTESLANLVDADTNTAVSFPMSEGPLTIDLSTAQPFTARSIVLYPAKKSFTADIELQAKEKGIYKTVSSFFFNRTNFAVNVGPVPYSVVAVSFPMVSSNNYRIVVSNIKNGDGDKTAAAFAEIFLRSAATLERYPEKQLDKMYQTPLPLWNEYQWVNQKEAEDSSLGVRKNAVLDISDKLAADGTINWNAPAGKWVIMRIGVTPTGTRNSPAAPNATGFEVDKMNTKYLEHHFDAYLGKILHRIPEADRTALKYVVMDSYEMGSQNWTEGLAGDFVKKYGYDPIPWLPVLSGRIVDNADASNRFLWDLRRLVADRVAYDYVGGLKKISAKHGLKVWLENYGHWGFPSEFLMYGGQSSDIAGEFWNEGTLGNIECRAASSAAHIYGHQRVYAESYTAAGKDFARYPGTLKKRGDWSFTEGINHVLLHVYVQQAYEDKWPGMNAWFGTEFNRKNTWFDQSKNWIDYQRRCMFLLQQGRVVNDIAYFIGEDAPKMTGVRNPEIPKGYQYDYINGEVIRQRLSVTDGKLMLPDGMSYRLLVLPQLETMRPELLRKIKTLVEEGAAVLGPAPLRSPSLQGYPAADREVKDLAASLWGEVDGKKVTSRRLGKGIIMSGVDIATAMAAIDCRKDLEWNTTDSLLYIHRSEPGKEIYFITNQSDKAIDFSPAFRVTGKQPELFDATNGTHRLLPEFAEGGGMTTIPMHLDIAQSFFIVFRHATSGIKRSGKNFPKTILAGTISSPWQVRFDNVVSAKNKTLVFPQLTDWSISSDSVVRYYSGTATYSNHFRRPEIASGRRVLLHFDDVKDMAVVKINGKTAGAIWTLPYQVDITDVLKAGDNEISVEVVNTWVNRLVGDSRLPVADRKTWIPVNNFKPDQKLEPSGLIGRAELLTVKY